MILATDMCHYIGYYFSLIMQFQLNPEWLVVAGGESEEVAIQNQRLRGVLEAIYPRPSSIPPELVTVS